MNPIWKMVLKKTGMICLATILFALCSVLIYITKVTGSIQRLDENPEVPVMTSNPNLDESTQEKLSEYWTIAVFGLDSRRQGEGILDSESNADTQMICSINQTTGDVRLVSVYRDTYLMNEQSTGTYDKINQSYFLHGAAGNAAALSTNLDLTIDDFMAFNWKAVAEGISLLGGVDIELTKGEFFYMNSFITETVSITGLPSVHLEEAGMQHLDGVQAVAYMRLRLMDSDFKRTERQRRVVSQVLEKAKGADWGTLLQVMETVFPQIGISMDQSELFELARNIKNYNIVDTAGFPFTHQEANMGKKGACIIPNTLESNVEQLHQFLYGVENYVCSDRVKEISREIIKRAVKN